MPPSLASAVAVAPLARFRRRFPRARVRLREAPTEDLLVAVEKGDLDGTVVVFCEQTRHFETSLIPTDYVGVSRRPKPALTPTASSFAISPVCRGSWCQVRAL
jgi:DNA-binding transcriptional LysR family regulator